MKIVSYFPQCDILARPAGVSHSEDMNMKFNTHGNGNGLNDLYVLPESKDEEKAIINHLNKIGRGYRFSFSDVMGQSWYGQTFIEITFGESLQKELESLGG